MGDWYVLGSTHYWELRRSWVTLGRIKRLSGGGWLAWAYIRRGFETIESAPLDIVFSCRADAEEAVSVAFLERELGQ